MRFYVSMTWDDFPEGGSYGTIVHADTHEQAENDTRWMMAFSRITGDDEFIGPIDESTLDEINECYSDGASDWDVVDCFDLDEFIEKHSKPTGVGESPVYTYSCSQCGSANVQMSLPTWYDMNTGDYVEADGEADPMYHYCPDCSSTELPKREERDQ